MNRRGTGIVFITLAVILYICRTSVHFISASILAINEHGLGSGTMDSMLDLVGQPYPHVFEIASLFLGGLYLIWAEVESFRNEKKSRN